MTEVSPGARAVQTYEIEDVFVVSTDCRVARDFDQCAAMTDFTFGQQSRIDKEVLVQTRTPLQGGEAVHILRYFVDAEVRLLRPGIKLKAGEPGFDSDFLAVLKFTLATDYRCPKESLEDKAAISAFSRNAYFHAWSYLREEVNAACGRLRIPRFVLPMLKPEQVKAVKTEAIHKPALESTASQS